MKTNILRSLRKFACSALVIVALMGSVAAVSASANGVKIDVTKDGTTVSYDDPTSNGTTIVIHGNGETGSSSTEKEAGSGSGSGTGSSTAASKSGKIMTRKTMTVDVAMKDMAQKVSNEGWTMEASYTCSKIVDGVKKVVSLSPTGATRKIAGCPYEGKFENESEARKWAEDHLLNYNIKKVTVDRSDPLYDECWYDSKTGNGYYWLASGQHAEDAPVVLYQEVHYQL